MQSSKEIFAGLIDRAREPVIRTTFMLSRDAVNALQWMSDELDVQIRDVAHLALCNNEQSPVHSASGTCVEEILDRITNSAAPDRTDYTERRNLSLRQDTVDTLNGLARKHEIARDVLINHMILYARECLAEMVRERDEERQAVMAELDHWLQYADKVLDRVSSALNDTDPCRIAIENFVTRTRDEFSSLCSDYPSAAHSADAGRN